MVLVTVDIIGCGRGLSGVGYDGCSNFVYQIFVVVVVLLVIK